MKLGVVIFPGSNCDQDLLQALSTNFPFQVVELWHKDPDLKECTHIFIPGGFSYGDYLRSGAIAKLSPVMKSVQNHALNGGFVMGICNGFQILCESGLLPGVLIQNSNRKFICKDVYIRPEKNPFYHFDTLHKSLCIPIAHGEGQYYADADTLNSLITNQQILFTYCNKEGVNDIQYNPNGSLHHIAGICNTYGNIVGMMPHPERVAFDFLHNTDGVHVLKSLLKAHIPLESVMG